MKNKKQLLISADQSIADTSGKILFFSFDRFEKEICEGDSCFLCGAKRCEVTFNDEHIISEWILRDLDFFDREITLPNGNSLKYSKYKVPCCENCNSFLGKEVEQPISELFKGGYTNLIDYLNEKGPFEIFIWMAFLFLKTHIKDKYLYWHLDIGHSAPER